MILSSLENALGIIINIQRRLEDVAHTTDK